VNGWKELETCGSDALTAVTAKIKPEEVHRRSYHPRLFLLTETPTYSNRNFKKAIG
jgi:hypothetical protein